MKRQKERAMREERMKIISMLNNNNKKNLKGFPYVTRVNSYGTRLQSYIFHLVLWHFQYFLSMYFSFFFFFIGFQFFSSYTISRYCDPYVLLLKRFFYVEAPFLFSFLVLFCFFIFYFSICKIRIP